MPYAKESPRLMIMSAEKLNALLEATSLAKRVLILTHNDPDPDAIGSAVALRHLLVSRQEVEVKIAYRGIIGRSENKALVRYLEHPIQRLTRADLAPPVTIALVDTQPSAGNSPVRQFSNITLVLDHHPWRPESAVVPFVDVRPDIGSTSTILCEYLRSADLELPAPIATALFYGIKTDTMGLGRSATTDDVEAYAFLVPRINSQALFEIERAQVPAAYFTSLVTTLQAVEIYQDVLIVYIGWMDYPDLAAEIADWLLRLRSIQWVICLGGHKDYLNLAVRSRHRHGGAGNLAETVIAGEGTAGGHGAMAGGQIRLNGRDPQKLANQISLAVLAYFNIDPEETRRMLLSR